MAVTSEIRSHIRFTYEDYLLFPDDRNRHELIDGEHVMTPSPTVRHQLISARLCDVLYRFVKERRLGIVLAAPMDVVLSDVDVVEPDLLFVATENRSIITADNIQGAPDLVVEIVSEASRRHDKMVKKKLYARYGVREYWIVDPVVDEVEVYVLQAEGYQKLGTYHGEDPFSSVLFPGLVMDLAEVFREDL